MINIIDCHIHCNDETIVTAIDIKLKARPEEAINEKSQHLIARISAAFNSLNFFAEYGKTFKMDLNPKRSNIANMHISLWENILTFTNVGEFLDAFRQELTKSPF